MRPRLAALVLLSSGFGTVACGSGGPLETAATGPAVSISPLGVSLDAIGAREHLRATVFDAMGIVKPEAMVAWATQDASIATVDEGIVVARRNGTTFIDARYDTLVGSIEVRVRQVGVTLFKVSGDAQSGTVGMPLSRPLVAEVDDRLGNPAQGITVYFRIMTGNGSLTPASPHTDAQGIVQTTWTLGTAAGDQIVAASLTPGAVTPALYNARAANR